MSKEMLVIALGVWVAVIPYLGFPGSWRSVLLVLSGIALVALGFFLRAEALSRSPRKGPHHLFVENSEAQHEPHHHNNPHHGAETKERITSLN